MELKQANQYAHGLLWEYGIEDLALICRYVESIQILADIFRSTKEAFERSDFDRLTENLELLSQHALEAIQIVQVMCSAVQAAHMDDAEDYTKPDPPGDDPIPEGLSIDDAETDLAGGV